MAGSTSTADVVTVTTPTDIQNVGSMPVLPAVIGKAKKLKDGSTLSRTLSSVQVFVKPFLSDTQAPTAPTTADLSGGANAVPQSNIQFFGNELQEYHWQSTAFPVRTAGNGKNKVFVFAKWVVEPTPSNPMLTFEPDNITLEFQATTGTTAATFGQSSINQFQPSTSVAGVASDANNGDILPVCRDGDWLLYKDIPASSTGSGTRLMLNAHTPLRAFELEIAAADVQWELALLTATLLGIRRASGSNFGAEPTGSSLVFPYQTLPRWAVVVDQETSLVPWIPNPFVVHSHTRCHPDVAVVNPVADVYVRLNYPTDLYLMVRGSYSLWVKPSLGHTTCGIPACPGNTCSTGS